MFPLATDSWSKRGVAAMATIIETTALARSDHGARLKNNHHTTMATPAAKPPSTPYIAPSGTTRGMTNQPSH
jgi:hypothetical protein